MIVKYSGHFSFKLIYYLYMSINTFTKTFVSAKVPGGRKFLSCDAAWGEVGEYFNAFRDDLVQVSVG